MLFEKKYPNMKPINEEHRNIMRGKEAQPCCVCGRMTTYIEINYEAYFCSDECVNKMDKEVYERLSEKPMKVKSKTRHKANGENFVQHFCPKCMQEIYRKNETVCPKCGQLLERSNTK